LCHSIDLFFFFLARILVSFSGYINQNVTTEMLCQGGMYPELITRPDLKVFLPPIGGISVYIFGNPEFISGKFFCMETCGVFFLICI
jgi:hypothetical protein